jgi:hypothetical protein
MYRMLIPYYDQDTTMLYLAGKGDGNIRYFEWVAEEQSIYYLSEYKTTDPLRGICFLPKRAVSVNETEVARAFKAHPTYVEPISFKVPRKVVILFDLVGYFPSGFIPRLCWARTCFNIGRMVKWCYKGAKVDFS